MGLLLPISPFSLGTFVGTVTPKFKLFGAERKTQVKIMEILDFFCSLHFFLPNYHYTKTETEENSS